MFGPTCDGLDTLLTDYALPELQVIGSSLLVGDTPCWPADGCGVPAVHGTGLQMQPAALMSGQRHLAPAVPALLARPQSWSPSGSSLPLLLPPISTHPLPQVGDWLLFPAMGAYTLCGASKFNGIDATAPSTFYIASRH